jgi:hypothetical protein
MENLSLGKNFYRSSQVLRDAFGGRFAYIGHNEGKKYILNETNENTFDYLEAHPSEKSLCGFDRNNFKSLQCTRIYSMNLLQQNKLMDLVAKDAIVPSLADNNRDVVAILAADVLADLESEQVKEDILADGYLLRDTLERLREKKKTK